MEPDELKAMVEKIRDVEQAFGDGMKNGARDEEKENFSLRRSIIAARDIAEGRVITAEDIVIKRPGYGILPQFRDIVTGRTAKRDIKADEWITWEMV
jgi:sialic acid synthase SpsE